MNLTKWVLLAFAALAAAGAATYRSTVDHLSCARCRSLRDDYSSSGFGLRFSHSEITQLSTNVGVGHVHRWWRYSHYTATAVSKSVACKPYRFEDKTIQP